MDSKSDFFEKRWILTTTLLSNNFKLRSLLKGGRISRRIPRSDSEPLGGWFSPRPSYPGWWNLNPPSPLEKYMCQSPKWVGFIFPNFWGFQIPKTFENCHQNPCIETMGFKRPEGENLPAGNNRHGFTRKNEMPQVVFPTWSGTEKHDVEIQFPPQSVYET